MFSHALALASRTSAFPGRRKHFLPLMFAASPAERKGTTQIAFRHSLFLKQAGFNPLNCKTVFSFSQAAGTPLSSS